MTHPRSITVAGAAQEFAPKRTVLVHFAAFT